MYLKLQCRLIIVLIFFCKYIALSQSVHGKVTNFKGDVLENANIYVKDSSNLVSGSISDVYGEYFFLIPKSGKYQIECSYVGYQTVSFIIFIDNQENLKIDFQLENVLNCDIIPTISENPYKSGDLTMTQQQYKVMPASFQDPSRIMLRYPGFSTANDGANSILFRGMPPEATRWQLFGADIVNPNHLSNAGTANDLATGNAGGVNALSGSVLGYYHFEANPADISFANVLSGVSNMEIAPNIKSFIDLNLIGLEAGLSLNNDNAAGYFKNIYAAYRYSFVGVLNTLGVDFGNEKIGYQDLTLHADLYRSYNKSLKVFSTLGSSRNMLTPLTPTDSIARYKDLQQIDYKSTLGIGGLQFMWNGHNHILKSTLVSSFRTDTRNEVTDALSQPELGFLRIRNNNREERMLSSNTVYQFVPEMNIDAELFFKLGVRMNLFSNSFLRDQEGKIIQGFMFYPYYQMEGTLKDKFGYKFGLGVLYENVSEKWTTEPLVHLHYALNKKLGIALDCRFSSMQNFTEIEQLNRSINEFRMQSGNYQLGIEYKSDKSLIKTSFFYHDIGDISNYKLSDGMTTGHFNAFNGSNLGYDLFLNYPEIQFNGLSNARSYGFDIYHENSINLNTNVLRYMLNSSFFESSYSLPEAMDRFYSAKYDFRYSANASVSYTMNFSGTEREKSLILAIAGHYRGALREQTLIEDPDLIPYNIYDFRSPFVNSFRPYQRIDCRIVYTRKKTESRLSHRWSLDIQNIMSRENDGFRYFDPLLATIQLQPQLGLVPVLSYRMEW